MARDLSPLDLEMFYSGMGGHPFMDIDGIKELRKAAEIIDTTVSGYLNPIYGAKAWVQANAEHNVFGMLPKTTWDRSGIRAIQDWESDDVDDVAIGQTDTLPDSVRPDLATIKLTPKIVAKTFELSDVHQALAELGADDIFGSLEHLRAFRATDFARIINKTLMYDVEAEAAAASGDYSEGKRLQTLDRIISNDAEEDAYGGTYDGYYDYYDVDRDGPSAVWGDSIVKLDSTANQELDDELLRKTINDAKEKGGQTSAMLTGWDTYGQLQGIYQSNLRYHQWNELMVEMGVNGIKTAKGTNVGMPIAGVLGVPVVVSQDVPVDGVSRIYGMDFSDPEAFGEPRMSMSTIRPIEYFESRDFILLNKFVMKGAYRFVGETVCRFFPGQFKIRDLAE